MKTYFLAIFIAVMSLPVGVGSAILFHSYQLRPSLTEAAAIGGQVNGVLLVVALVLYFCSIPLMKQVRV